MWPYTANDAGWRTLEKDGRPKQTETDLSPERVEYEIAKARALRALFIRRLVSRLFGGQKTRRTQSAAPLTLAQELDQLAHDLRTPLTSIRNFSEIIRDQPDLPRDQMERYLDGIVKESKRLEKAISYHEGQLANLALR